MLNIDAFWGLTMATGAGLLVLLGLMFWFITRSAEALTVRVRCPMTGTMTVVQHIADENSFVTDVVSCAAFLPDQPVTCGLPCLTGGVRTRIPAASEHPVRI